MGYAWLGYCVQYFKPRTYKIENILIAYKIITYSTHKGYSEVRAFPFFQSKTPLT